MLSNVPVAYMKRVKWSNNKRIPLEIQIKTGKQIIFQD